MSSATSFEFSERNGYRSSGSTEQIQEVESQVEDTIANQNHETTKFAKNLVRHTIDKLLEQMKPLDQGDRIEMLQKLDSLLSSNSKVTRAVQLINKTRRNRKRKRGDFEEIEYKAATSLGKWTKSRSKIAAKLLVACFGEDQVGPGIDCVSKGFRMKNTLFYRSKEDLEQLQLMYTRLAAELYVRWGLTTRQYKMARRLMLVSSTWSLNEDIQREVNHNKKNRLNLSERNGMVPLSMGIQVWPTLNTLSADIARVQAQLSVGPSHERDRNDVGQFNWTKQSSQLRQTWGEDPSYLIHEGHELPQGQEGGSHRSSTNQHALDVGLQQSQRADNDGMDALVPHEESQSSQFNDEQVDLHEYGAVDKGVQGVLEQDNRLEVQDIHQQLDHQDHRSLVQNVPVNDRSVLEIAVESDAHFRHPSLTVAGESVVNHSHEMHVNTSGAVDQLGLYRRDSLGPSCEQLDSSNKQAERHYSVASDDEGDLKKVN